MDVLDQEPALKALKLLGQELSTAATGFDTRFVGELVDQWCTIWLFDITIENHNFSSEAIGVLTASN